MSVDSTSNLLTFPRVLTEDEQIRRAIEFALEEDVATGDVSSHFTTTATEISNGTFIAKAPGVVAGLAVVDMVFARVSPLIKTSWLVADGSPVAVGDVIGTVEGPSRAVLIGERVALNFMQRMSGIATMTNRYVAAIAAVGSSTRILDTRKTAPCLRAIDKLAVRLGGGKNHRTGLYDMIMVKDNHIKAAGGIAAAMERVSAGNSAKLPVEVETSSLDEVRQALAVQHLGVTRLMFDNMTPRLATADGSVAVDTALIAEAQRVVDEDQAAKAARGELPAGAEGGAGKKIETEVSGNVTLETVGSIAATGVDFVSSGQLTHSVTALDISLKLK